MREPHAHPRERWAVIMMALTLGVPGGARRATTALTVHRGRLGEAGGDGEAREEALLYRLREVLERALRPLERRAEVKMGSGCGGRRWRRAGECSLSHRVLHRVLHRKLHRVLH